MQRCKHRRKFCFVVLPLPKKFFDTFWEPLIRLDLKRGFTPKKAHAYKSPVLARLSDGSGLFPPRILSAQQLRSIQLRGAISLCALPPTREYAIPNIYVRQKSTGNFHAYTLALYHILLLLSIQNKHLFVYFNEIFCRYIIDICE